MKVFLSATWRHLVNLTYRVPPEKLLPLLPPGVELDVIDGHAFVSLVAFDFLHTKVRGVTVPFHTNFPEVNLRYYVKHRGRRGVVFIKEYVPKHCIAFIANRFYNEPYVSYPMESGQETLEDGRHTSTYRIWKDKNKYRLDVTAGAQKSIPAEDTMEHYFKEHDIGFGTEKKGDTLYYLVQHPVWETREIEKLELNYDFEVLYGPEWAFLNDTEPSWKVFCEGSPIKVFSAARLTEKETAGFPDGE